MRHDITDRKIPTKTPPNDKMNCYLLSFLVLYNNEEIDGIYPPLVCKLLVLLLILFTRRHKRWHCSRITEHHNRWTGEEDAGEGQFHQSVTDPVPVHQCSPSASPDRRCACAPTRQQRSEMPAGDQGEVE